jgi:long-chain acyl-CoA synthetase
METLGLFLKNSARQFGSHPALLFKEGYRTKNWSYNQLLARSLATAGWLEKQGVKKGDRVVIWAPNSPYWVMAYFGALHLGASLVPLDVRVNKDFVHNVVKQTEPVLAFLSETNLTEWAEATPAHDLKILETVEGDQEFSGDPTLSADDIAEIMFTSGTTGDPKGVLLTHRNILSNVDAVNNMVPHIKNYRMLSILPLSHMFEQTLGLLQPLKQGASIFYPANIQSNTLFEAMQDQNITTILMVPQVLELFMNSIEREVKRQGREKTWQMLQNIAGKLPMGWRHFLFGPIHKRLGGHLKFLVVGGAYLNPDLIGKWERLGIPILQGYGLTECSPILTGSPLNSRNPESVGRPISGVELKLSPEGEILVRGKNITQGYWHNPKATAAVFTEDGWFRTGDLGSLDDKGYVFLKGRMKDMIVLANGQNVFPEDIERVLKKLSGLKNAVVLADPHSKEPQVHAVLLGENALGRAEGEHIIQQANARLAAHQRIRGFSIWPQEDFPLTHTLKVKKHEVARAIREQADHKSEPQPEEQPEETADDRTGARLLALVAELGEVDPARLNLQSKLGDDAGLDSLGLVELLASIEEHFGQTLDETRLGPDTTLAELQATLEGKAGATLIESKKPEFKRWPLSGPVSLIRQALQGPMRGLFGLVVKTRVEGRENLGGLKGPAIFVATHTSHLDSPTILEALPGKVRRKIAIAAAADYFFSKKWLGFISSLLFNAFPFSRGGSVRPSLLHCAWLIEHGWSILIYPEGTRTTSGKVGSFKPGIGLLAVEMGAPVVPVNVEGLFEILPKGKKLPRPGAASVRIGPPLCFGRSVTYEEATREIEQAVRQLAGETGRSN